MVHPGERSEVTVETFSTFETNNQVGRLRSFNFTIDIKSQLCLTVDNVLLNRIVDNCRKRRVPK